MGKGKKKFLQRSSQKAEISVGMFLQIQTDIYIDEGVRPVAWQQCKHSLFDVRDREGC